MTFAWQGWKVSIPESWNPVKLEGDFENGYALIADLHRPQVGLRWSTLRRGRAFEAKSALVSEVGSLAASEAKKIDDDEHWRGAMLYIEPDPPGRDVWIAQSAISNRVIELVYHVRERERDGIDALRESLDDSSPAGPLQWGAFQLSCASGEGFRLKSHQLNAGDLSLTFARRRDQVTIRQIALASLALRRMPLEKWLLEQQRRHLRTHRPCGATRSSAITTSDGRSLAGIAGSMSRRRRFFWNRALAPSIDVAALHDKERDRLVLGDASSQALLEEVCRTIGWAECGSPNQDPGSRAATRSLRDRLGIPPSRSTDPSTAARG